MKKIILLGLATILLIGGGSAVALMDFSSQKVPVVFYAGHTHSEDGVTHGGPQHSGGTDINGCHNRSVPYHCH